jgi:aspartate/tyrosine/aromatic aminotransferase
MYRLILKRSYFTGVFKKIEEDVIFKTQTEFMKDPSKMKVNLGIGIYADQKGNLPFIKNRYLPLSGDTAFLNASEKFVFNTSVKNMFKFQTCGGTGALRLTADIMNLKSDYTSFIPLPTWPNHTQIFKNNILNSNELNLKGKKTDIIVVQTSCHNPTGIEYNYKQKKDILEYAEKHNITILFDTAYLGLSGNFNSETEFLSMGLEKNINMFVALSYSKIADAYGHRVGVLFFRPYNLSDNELENVKPNVEKIIRNNISNSPRYGSDMIMEKYLSSDEKIKEFKNKIKTMADRINFTRLNLSIDLSHNNINTNIGKGKGMFSVLPFSPDEIYSLKKNYHIYILPNGRINICGITDDNYDYALNSIVENHKKFI